MDPGCIRRISNWSTINKYHKFDKPEFDPELFQKDISSYSPKLNKLLENIRELDKNDMDKDGKLYKHIIFSEVKQMGCGIKIITAGLLSENKWKLAYNNKIQLYTDVELKKNKNYNFILLSSNSIYDTDISVKNKKILLNKFNERPDNIHGELARIILIDSGFREGIDLFDVKYVHIFEPQVSKADFKQVIGRATRLCGQKGLVFHPKNGWILNVYLYDVAYNSESLHDLYVKHSGIDLKLLSFSDELERKTITGAVDYELTEKIHNFDITGGYLADMTGGGISKEVFCDKKCGLRPNKNVPVSLALFITIATVLKINLPRTKKLRPFFCALLKEDPEFCKQVKIAANDPADYISKHSIELSNNTSGFAKRMISNYASKMIKKIDSAKPDKIINVINTTDKITKTHTIDNDSPNKIMKFDQMRNYIKKYYSDYKWDDVKMKNLCVAEGGAERTMIKFTPTQEFVRNYFTSDSMYKGILLWHSTGSGKTCSAIATATTGFKDYTILWVTRTTLKNDIWKNMFDQVCSLDLKDTKIPIDPSKRLKLLNKNWSIRPMSYKQFTNLVSGKNALYEQLIKKNGKTDPLRKTLLIIDEAHKLYGGNDLSSIERPNMKKLKESIMTSYRVSGVDSVKLMLMTATPITNDPMEMIKLLNLCKEQHEQMPENLKEFSENYLDDTGYFTKKGKNEYLDDISGYVSYLSREKDARQFSQPKIIPVQVDIGKGEVTNITVQSIENSIKIKEEQDKLLAESYKNRLNEIHRHKLERKKFLKDACREYKGALKSDCINRIAGEVANMENEYEVELTDLFNKVDNLKINKKNNIQELKEAKTKLKEDKSQLNMLESKCRK